jgi:hypothetical protein
MHRFARLGDPPQPVINYVSAAVGPAPLGQIAMPPNVHGIALHNLGHHAFVPDPSAHHHHHHPHNAPVGAAHVSAAHAHHLGGAMTQVLEDDVGGHSGEPPDEDDVDDGKVLLDASGRVVKGSRSFPRPPRQQANCHFCKAPPHRHRRQRQRIEFPCGHAFCRSHSSATAQRSKFKFNLDTCPVCTLQCCCSRPRSDPDRCPLAGPEHTCCAISQRRNKKVSRKRSLAEVEASVRSLPQRLHKQCHLCHTHLFDLKAGQWIYFNTCNHVFCPTHKELPTMSAPIMDVEHHADMGHDVQSAAAAAAVAAATAAAAAAAHAAAAAAAAAVANGELVHLGPPPGLSGNGGGGAGPASGPTLPAHHHMSTPQLVRPLAQHPHQHARHAASEQPPPSQQAPMQQQQQQQQQGVASGSHEADGGGGAPGITVGGGGGGGGGVGGGGGGGGGAGGGGGGGGGGGSGGSSSGSVEPGATQIVHDLQGSGAQPGSRTRRHMNLETCPVCTKRCCCTMDACVYLAANPDHVCCFLVERRRRYRTRNKLMKGDGMGDGEQSDKLVVAEDEHNEEAQRSAKRLKADAAAVDDGDMRVPGTISQPD